MEKYALSINSSPFPLHTEVYDTLESTNDTAKLRGRAGEPEGLVVIARHQTHGKGRMGRSFYSPEAVGLYMSILLRPKLSPERCLNLTTAVAVSTARACEALSGRPAKIKWVNDIFMGGRKVCGILTEAALEKTALDYAVVGIGVNIAPSEGGFPEELSEIAGTVFPKGMYEISTDPPLLFAEEILRRFLLLYEDLQAHPEDTPCFLPDYRSRLLGMGQRITVLRGEETYPAVLEGLDENFRLLLRRESGELQTLSSGEIRIKI